MKNVLTAAIVAALVASGSTYAATRISGSAIVKHSIPANRLTTKAVKAFTAQGDKAQAPRALAASVNSTLDYEQTTTTLDQAPLDVSATCPVGDVAIAGGYSFNRGRADITANLRTSDDSGWTVGTTNPAAPNDGNGPAVVTVYVSCEPGA